jgi:glycosyltransferase involved in cell wall biosynthesis
MPVYNTEKYINEAIQSIIDQTTQNWQLIIVDDCSTDNTSDILREWSDKDKRIWFQRSSKNEGHTKTLNKCLKIARGEYFAMMDSDDISKPDRLNEQAAVLFGGKIELVSTYGISIDDKGKRIKDFYTDEAQRRPIEEIKQTLPRDCWILGPSMMFTRRVFKKIGYFDPECYFGNDLNYWIRAMKHFRWAVVDKELYVKRRNPTSARTVPKATERDWHKFSFERAEKCPIVRHI